MILYNTKTDKRIENSRDEIYDPMYYLREDFSGRY